MRFGNTLPSVSHVAILTPYDGGNLGDAAIQEALIYNFRRCDAQSRITGITLNPAFTSALHHIPCCALAVNSRPYYYAKTRSFSSDAGHEPNNSPIDLGSEDSVFNRWKRRARSTPLFKPIKAVYRLAKEVRHAIQSYFFLRDVHLLVIAGGGQLDEEWGGSWGHPYALMKWATLARLAGSKLVFLSVGGCRIDSLASRLFIRVALSLATYRSYRDQGSREIGLQISKSADGPVVPDLAFSLPLTHINAVIETRRELPLVGVSPIAFAHPGLWPTERIAVYNRYITELSAFVSSLLQRGISVVLFSSSVPDEQTFRDIRDQVSSQITNEALMRLSSCEAATASELNEMLRSVDFVVASRLHGLLLSFLAGKPSIAISYDRKVQTLMEDMGQAEYCMDIHTFSRNNLLAAFLTLETNADSIPPKLRRIRDGYRELLEEQYKQVARYFVHASAGPNQAQLPVGSRLPVCEGHSDKANPR